MPVRLKDLAAVRSQQVEAALAYLRKIEEDLSRTPLLERFGRSLDDVRIPLCVVPFEPIRHKEVASQTEHLRPPVQSREEDEPSKKRYAFRGTPFEDEERSRSPQPLDKIEPQLQHAVLLADPGGGKTEWLKYCTLRSIREAITLLENHACALSEISFPVFLRLNDIAKVLGRDEKEETEQERVLCQFLVQTGCASSLPAGLDDAQRVAAAMLMVLVQKHHLPERLASFVWQRWLHARPGKVAPSLLCLDAWDEVRGGRETLARCANAFATVSACRIFLTSRIIGYTHRPLPVESKAGGPHRELRICPFEWSETEQFVTFWFRDDSQRGRTMLEELHSKVSLWGMAGNPLMATLLCLAYSPSFNHPPLTFPVQRGAVFERVLWGLMGEWRRLRGPWEQVQFTGEEKQRIQDKLNLLAYIAWYFFKDGTERFSRTALEGATDTYLSTEDSKSLLDSEAFRFLGNLNQEQKGYFQLLDDYRKQKWVCDQVSSALCQELIEVDGVLAKDSENEKEPYYGFLHLTFQEYFTACYLAKFVNEQGWKRAVVVEVVGSATGVREIVDKKAWDPNWEEVVVLLAGKLGDPMPLLELLTDEKKDDNFRYRLALVATSLPEVLSETRKLDSAIIDKITTAAFGLWWEHCMNGTSSVVPHLTRALPALGQVNGRVKSMPLLEWLYKCLGDANRDVRESSAWAVRGIGNTAATSVILAGLVKLLHDGDWQVRRAAGEALVGIGNVAARPEFSDCLAILHNEGAVSKVVQQIGSAATTPEFLARLTPLLGNESVSVRAAAAEAVGCIGGAAAMPAILDSVADLLRDENSSVRRAAALSVRNIGRQAATPEILAGLAETLRHKDTYVRGTAAEAVGCIGGAAATAEILARLDEMLRDGDFYVRRVAAKAFRSIGGIKATGELLGYLAQTLNNSDFGFLRRCMYDREVSDNYVDIALTRLTTLRYATAMVGSLGNEAATPEILDRLVNMLWVAEFPVLHELASQAIADLGKSAATPAVLARLGEMLHYEDCSMRAGAARAVGSFGRVAATPEILAGLAETLRHKDNYAQFMAAKAVGCIGGAAATPEMLGCLAKLLRDNAEAVLQTAADALRGIGPAAATSAILDGLSELLHHADPVVRMYAAHAVEGIGSAATTLAIIGSLSELLRDSDSRVRRASAEALGRIMAQGVRIFNGRLGKCEVQTVEELSGL